MQNLFYTQDVGKVGKLDVLGYRINALLIALVVLAAVLMAYLITECTLLVSFFYAKKHIPGPDSVIVKGGKSKSSKRSRRRSSKKQKKSISGRPPKKGQKSAGGTLSKAKSESKSKSKGSKSDKKSSSKGSKESTGSSKKESCSKKRKTNYMSERFSPGDATSNNTRTETQITRIPDQFGGIACDDTRTENQIRNLPDQFSTPDDLAPDTKTDDQIRRIPDQFCDTSKADNRRAVELSPGFVREVAAVVVEKLSAKSGKATSITPIPQFSGTDFLSPKLGLLEDKKAPVQQTTIPQQQAPVYQMAQRYPVPTQMTREGVPVADSIYLMEVVGPNGEIMKVPPIQQQDVTNSLMVDNQKVVPIDGAPSLNTNAGKPPSGK